MQSIESAAYSIGTNIATVLDNLIQEKLINEALVFKKNKNKKTFSKAFISPTIRGLEKEYNNSELENKVIFHSELSKKKQIENIDKINP